MGLDAGFKYIKDLDTFKKTIKEINSLELKDAESYATAENKYKIINDISTSVLYFRKFYELDNLLNDSNDYLIENDNSYIIVKYSYLFNLYNKLKPLQAIIYKLTEKELADVGNDVCNIEDLISKEELRVYKNALYEAGLEEDKSIFFINKIKELVTFLSYWCENTFGCEFEEKDLVYWRSY